MNQLNLKIPDTTTIKQSTQMYHIVRVTPAQRRRCNHLIRKLCANFDEGNCLPLDCICPQTTSYSLFCRYFRQAVLPNDEVLITELDRHTCKRCINCGTPLLPKSNRQKYCEMCSKHIHRIQKTESDRRRRNVDS